MTTPSPTPPRWLRAVLRRLAGPDAGPAMVADLDEEFRHYIAPEKGERAARHWYRRQAFKSLPAAVAARAARHRERSRHSYRGEHPMASLFQDLKYSLRSLFANPAFSLVIVGTLALGIGANTIIYSVVDGLVLNPFPFPDADRVVAVGTQYPRLGHDDLQFIEHISPAEYLDIRDESETLESIVAWDMGNRQVSMGDVTENIFTGFWWGDGFQAIGMPAHRGRGMSDEEIRRGDRVAVISHRLWSNAFGQDPDLVGGTIMMNGNPYTVVGVMPPRVVLYGMDLWIPMGASPEVFPRGRRQWQVIAHIRDGYEMEQVNTELEGLARRTEQEFAGEFEEYGGWRLEADTWTGANVRTLKPAAFILLGAVGFVLLLVCSNVASLLLARSSGRRREMAVRTALGAGRGRLLAQMLTESLVLSVAGGLVGLAIGWFGVSVVSDIVSTIPFLPGGVALNTRVLFFTAAVSVLAGVAFGIIPAMQASRGGLSSTLQSESAGAGHSRGRLRWQRVFVGVEVALALVLLVGGGLIINSIMRLNSVDPGFQDEGLLTMRLTLPNEEYDGPGIDAFFQTLQERVAALPTVEAVGVGSQLPTVAFSFGQVGTDETVGVEQDQLPTAMLTLARPGYFDALGIQLLSGRVFNDLDGPGSPMGAVINEAAAAMLFGDADPLGRRLHAAESELTVIGVVANTSNRGLENPPYPEVFGNHRQVPAWSNQLFLAVRTAGEARAVLPSIREEVRQIDADQPVYAIRTGEELMAGSTGTQRLAARVLSVFALFALALAAVGIYAVVSYTVGDRTREIGLRVALGAEGGQVRRLVVRQALVPVLIGGVVGLLGAVAVGRTLEGLLFEVRSTDPLTLASVAGILFVVALAASWLPALRASRMDPVVALRDD